MIENHIENQDGGKVVTLASPIIKNGESLTKISLRKPNAGHLRGLSLIKVCEMDFDACMTLLPRISDLNERDVLNLEPENFAPLMTAVATFFVATA